MAGYSRIYVLGGEGGFQGADGVNPIQLLILVGEAHRQWLVPHYFGDPGKPLGKLEAIVPSAPDHPDSLLDACLAFFPRHFDACPSLAQVATALGDTRRLDFEARPDEVPPAWAALREEARGIFATLKIWQADLVPLDRAGR